MLIVKFLAELRYGFIWLGFYLLRHFWAFELLNAFLSNFFVNTIFRGAGRLVSVVTELSLSVDPSINDALKPTCVFRLTDTQPNLWNFREFRGIDPQWNCMSLWPPKGTYCYAKPGRFSHYATCSTYGRYEENKIGHKSSNFTVLERRNQWGNCHEVLSCRDQYSLRRIFQLRESAGSPKATFLC